MIKTQDRSGWFGASDTAYIMGNWTTKSFYRFWLEKLGIIQNNFTNRAMIAGTHFEHRILDYLGIKNRDRQIKMRRLRLRVNLDGETFKIHEVKTYGGEKFKVSKAYWQQAQVEMFAARKPLEIVAYRLVEYDYINFFNPIDPERLSFHPIEFDSEWIINEYLPRLQYLSTCLIRRSIPNKEEFLLGNKDWH